MGLGLVVRAPLDLGVRYAKSQQKHAEAEAASEKHQEAIAGIAYEIQQAHDSLKEALAREKIQRKGEKAGRAWVNSMSQNFDLGLASTRDLSDALVAYFKARIQRLQAIHDVYITAARLQRASGVTIALSPKDEDDW